MFHPCELRLIYLAFVQGNIKLLYVLYFRFMSKYRNVHTSRFRLWLRLRSIHKCQQHDVIEQIGLLHP